jgi:hypothetical protein
MIIKLAKEYFWEVPTRYQRWPELLGFMPDVMEVRSKNEIATTFVHMLKDDKGRVHFDDFHGLFGAEPGTDGFSIYGCNLIEWKDGKYSKTNSALILEEAFRNGDNWQVLLMEQVLKYSLRFRAIANALLNGGELVFPKGFLKNYSQAYLLWKGVQYHVFSKHKDVENLNSLMKLDINITLGPFWINEMQKDCIEPIYLCGVASEEPSLHSLDTWLRNPLYLANELGWIKDTEENKFILDPVEVKNAIRIEVFESLTTFDEKTEEMALLKKLISNSADHEGYFPVEAVGIQLMKALDPGSEKSTADWIDQYFLERQQQGKFTISGYMQGYPMHGRGLLGNIKKQLIRIEF